ncbi:hypothetical protein JOC27_000300 [Sporolactobacillus spathodeae]|uniref:Uncharacterized protein n=1 Tax=Sporolactobacillus spathodeae TaxID=1465502 RepID=A0ABS2Q561_9BACL|nr:hypothetical protein [Sporolactobacillus spathodeae]
MLFPQMRGKQHSPMLFLSARMNIILLELTPYTHVLVVGLQWASPSAALDKIYLIEDILYPHWLFVNQKIQVNGLYLVFFFHTFFIRVSIGSFFHGHQSAFIVFLP